MNAQGQELERNAAIESTPEVEQVFTTAADSWREGRVGGIDQTCVASQGFVLAAKIDWKNFDLEMVQVSDDKPAWDVVRQMEESTWYSVVRLPEAVSSPAWCALHAELQPKVAEVCRAVQVEYYDACNKQRAVFPPQAKATKDEILQRLRRFDGGSNKALRATTMEFLNDRMHHNFTDFTILIDDIGTLTTSPDWDAVQAMAKKVSTLAFEEGAALCDDPLEFLRSEISMMEAHSLESPSPEVVERLEEQA